MSFEAPFGVTCQNFQVLLPSFHLRLNSLNASISEYAHSLKEGKTRSDDLLNRGVRSRWSLLVFFIVWSLYQIKFLRSNFLFLSSRDPRTSY